VERPVGYRGPDRRGKSPLAAHATHPAWYAVLCCIAVVVGVVAIRAADLGGTGLVVTFTALRDTGAGLLVLAGTVTLVVWALTGRASRVLDGSALLIAGGGMLMFAGPWSEVLNNRASAVLIGPGARLILGVPALSLLIAAGRVDPVHSSLRPWRVLTFAAAGAFGVLAVEVAFRSEGPIDRPAVLAVIVGVLAAGWIAAGLLRIVKPAALAATGECTFGWSLVAIGGGDVLFGLGLGGELRWAVAGAALQLCGAIGVVRVAVGSLTAVLALFGNLRLQLAGELTEVSNVLADEKSIRHSLLHDARNVVTAIRAANVTLERHGDRLDEQLQEHLRTTIGSEFGRLQELLEPTVEPSP
jgi:hypothetical protein